MYSVSFKLVYLWNYHEVTPHFLKEILKNPSNKQQITENRKITFFLSSFYSRGNLPDNKLPLNVNKTKVT